MFRGEGHSSGVGVSCRQVSPCYVILSSCAWSYGCHVDVVVKGSDVMCV
jgi:hypothetical protein